MINKNQSIKLPDSVKWYFLTKILLIFALISLVGLTSGTNGVYTIFTSFSIIFGIPIFIYVLLVYNNVFFQVEDNLITINHGILIKKSKTIPFDKVQNINCVQGILQGMFGLSILKIWTASPAQISVQDANSIARPDGTLILTKAEAEELRGIILAKKS